MSGIPLSINCSAAVYTNNDVVQYPSANIESYNIEHLPPYFDNYVREDI